MHITFILPAIGKKPGKPYIRTWQTMEPLTFSVLKALTPGHVETRFFDDRNELIDDSLATDLVAMTCEFYTARRAYAIADRYRARGVPVVIGGYHATLCLQEVAGHADCVVAGNAESVWQTLLADFAAGRLQKIYRGECRFADVIPDRSIFRGKRYSSLGVVETGRGCFFSCEFCAITAYYGHKYYRKPVEYVLRDIKSSGKKFFFFADDNIVADPAYARELFEALIPLRIKWSGQGSLNLARDPQLLALMKRSGCEMILVGYESLSEANLKQMNKAWLAGLGEVDALTRCIHRAGIHIYATFVIGFDADTPGLINRTLAFAKKHNFYFTAFNHLLPVPGTPLHERLIKEQRLLDGHWWLNPRYRYGDVVIRAQQMQPAEIAAACLQARQKYFSLGQLLKRSFVLIARKVNFFMYFYFWYISLNLKKEVDGKYGLPIGEGLDEYPK